MAETRKKKRLKKIKTEGKNDINVFKSFKLINELIDQLISNIWVSGHHLNLFLKIMLAQGTGVYKK